jgi:guanine nucleotide-binding protein subunit alpha, other
MRLIHNVQFSPQEVEFYRQLTFSNIVHGMKQLLEALDDMDLQISETVEEYARLLEDPPDVKDGAPFPRDYYQPLKFLWADETVQKAWKRGNEAALPDKYG